MTVTLNLCTWSLYQISANFIVNLSEFENCSTATITLPMISLVYQSRIILITQMFAILIRMKYTVMSTNKLIATYDNIIVTNWSTTSFGNNTSNW